MLVSGELQSDSAVHIRVLRLPWRLGCSIGKESACSAGDRLPMQETWVWSLGREDPLEKGMVTHSSILAWEVPWRGAWRAIVHGVTKSQAWLTDWKQQSFRNVKVTKYKDGEVVKKREDLGHRANKENVESWTGTWNGKRTLLGTLEILRKPVV